MACPGSGAILSDYGNSVDYPIETLDSLEPERETEGSPTISVEDAVLENYITG
jgi:hypothetical protein